MSNLVQLSVDELAEQFAGDSYGFGTASPDGGATQNDIKEALKDATLYISLYEQACYEGYALVVWEKNGELFLVEGSHCSCYGLEGQWSPEKTDWRALAKREFYSFDEVQSELKTLSSDKARLVGVQV